MADQTSPFAQQPIVTSQAPQSKLSGSDIAQPYQSLARGLDKIGEGLGDRSVELAEKAGAQAVTRDDQGNIQVEQAPIIGPARAAYRRAVKVAALAEADGAAQRADIDLRQQYRDDPQGYLAASDAFRRKQIDQMTDAAGPEVGVALGRAIDRTTTMTYRGLLNEKERLDLQRADNSITAGVNSASDDAIALARQGAPLNSPEMQGLLGKYTTLLDEKLKNPRLAYTQEQHDLDIQQFQGQLAGARNLYHVDQIYKDQSYTEKTLPDGTKVQEPNGGYAKAVEAAKDILTNPDYKLSPSQRQGFYSHAMGEIRANEAIRHQDIGEARESFRELTARKALGEKIYPDEVEARAQAFRAAGYPAGAAQVYAAFAHADLHDGHGDLPLWQQTQDLNSIRGAAAARSAFQFFTSRGYTPEQASGIVGNLIQESDVNPNAIHDRGTGLGIAGFRDERPGFGRMTNLKNYAASVRKPATDFQTQLEFIDRELHGSEATTLAALKLARTPEEAASAFINYERPAGYTPQNPAGGDAYATRRALARSVFQGSAVDGSGGPGFQSWMLANRQSTLKDAATKAWNETWSDWSNGKGGAPSKDRQNELVEAARQSGNVDLLTKVSRGLDAMDYAERISDLPVPQQVAAATELHRRIALADAPFPGAELVEKQIQDRTQAIQKGLEDNPIATTVLSPSLRDKLKTPPPLNLQDPQALVAGLKMRAQIAQAGAAKWQVGPLPALDSQDVAQVKAALASPDPAAKAGIYGAIAQLPEDVRGATLRKLGGNEPQGMAEAAAGSLMATDPGVAASIFRGQAAMKADKRYDPTDEQGANKSIYLSDLDKELPSNAFTLQDRTDPAGAYSTMATMIKARYADLQAQKGSTTYAKATLHQAVTDVTGGILSHNGGSLVAPARGMSQGQFDGVMGGIKDDDLRGVTTLSGSPVTAAYLRSSARLESVGDGKYHVLLGNDPAKPVYAYQGANGELPTKFVLDLRGRGAAPLSSSSDFIRPGP